MILLPSDPLYEVVMADQAEENQSNVIAAAFRSKIYCLSSEQDWWNNDQDNNYFEQINDYADDDLVADQNGYASSFVEYGETYLNDTIYPDNTGSRLDELETQIFCPEQSEEGNGTWVDPNEE